MPSRSLASSLLCVPRATPGRGFTLIEMMVVITIIVTLMGLLAGAVMIVQKDSQKTRAIASLKKIEAALYDYRAKTGTFPEKTVAGLTPQALTDAGFIGASATFQDPGRGTPDLGKLEQNGRLLWAVLRTYYPGDFVGGEFRTGFHDVWKKGILYLPAAQYPDYAKPDPMPKPDDFLLWSRGYNEKNDPITSGPFEGLPFGGGDDLSNFVR